MKNIFLIAIVISFCVSCGSKKKVVNRSQEKVVEIYQKAVDSQISNDITSNAVIIQQDSKITIKPSDPSKPSKYGGIEFQNAEITKEATNTNITTNVVDKSVTDLSKTDNSEKTVEKKTVDKNIDVDRSFNVFDWLWLFLAIAIVLFAIRLYVKRINPFKWIMGQLKR